jgi:hypothetical protein
VKGIPFVVFDAGGVLEMFDHRTHPDNVVFEPTLEALAYRLNSVSLSAFVAVPCLPTFRMYSDLLNILVGAIQETTHVH